MMNIFYVYMYLREDGTPYYVGKGKGNRAYNKGHREWIPPKDKSRIVFPFTELSEQDALDKETELIKLYGRKDKGTGILRNKTDGGDGVSGHIKSPELRKWISESQKGRKASEVAKVRMSEAQSKRWSSLNDEKRKIIRDNISAALKGKIVVSDKQRKQISENFKNTIYITDGVHNRRIDPTDTIPEGWRKGRVGHLRKKPMTEEVRQRYIEGCKKRKQTMESLGIKQIPWNKGLKTGKGQKNRNFE